MHNDYFIGSNDFKILEITIFSSCLFVFFSGNLFEVSNENITRRPKRALLMRGLTIRCFCEGLKKFPRKKKKKEGQAKKQGTKM